MRVVGYINTTLGGSPSWTAFNSDASPGYYDTAGTTVSGGTQFFSIVLAKSDSAIVDLVDFGIFLNPGDSLTIAAQSDVSNIVEVAINWNDLF